MGTIREVFAYRQMIFRLVKRDLRGRYKGSVLGFLWTFLNPLLQLVVYSLVFSAIMRVGIDNYYIFLFVGLVPWLFFSSCLTGGASCIWQQQDLVKKNPAALLFLPVVMFVELVLALGVTMVLSGLTVYFRDLEYIFSIISMAWMYLTPVMYSVDMVPAEYERLFYLNPMTMIIIAYRDILYYQQIPHLRTLVSGFAVGVVIFATGWFVFSRLKRNFAEEL